jgi:hypothetical protein
MRPSPVSASSPCADGPNTCCWSWRPARLMLHLGMSGSLRVVPAGTPPLPHDHIDLVLTDGNCLRLRDPRRFGSLHWVSGPVRPIRCSPAWARAAERRLQRRLSAPPGAGSARPVKAFIMDSHVVVGVGNIYANESLHIAGIHPHAPPGASARCAYDAPRQGHQAGCSPPPSPRAAPACATSSAKTATPATSPSPCASTVAPASPARLRRSHPPAPHRPALQLLLPALSALQRSTPHPRRHRPRK